MEAQHITMNLPPSLAGLPLLIPKVTPKLDLPFASSHDVCDESVDGLVLKGIRHIQATGDRIESRAGAALQSYDVNYVLLNSRSRVHTIRPEAKRYFARELLAYFSGNLKAEDGLARASKFWSSLTDTNGYINSNYGYYVFYQPVPHAGISNQYEWVIQRLLENPQTRRAIINVNQNNHKTGTKDFPCTISLNFFIRNNALCCEVCSRSTDIITGLPYDIGFFSLLTELVFADLRERGLQELELGYTMMKSTFTQIYVKHAKKAEEALCRPAVDEGEQMPVLEDAQAFLADVYNGTNKHAVTRWIHENAL